MDEEELVAFLAQFTVALEDLDEIDQVIILPAVEKYITNMEEWAQSDEIERQMIPPAEIEERRETLGYWKAIWDLLRNAP